MPFENVLPANSDTLLTISGMGHMLYQARGLTQTLQVIPAATSQGRTINGTLIDLSVAQFRKYTSKISCSDVNAPALDNLWPGMTVTVDCACSLCYAAGNPGSPARPEVSGSSYADGSPAFIYYRPILDMMIKDISFHFDEWKAVVGWEMDLEEI